MVKKKYVNIYYMFLLVVLFVTSLGLFSNCYAMTQEYLEDYLDSAKEFYATKYNNFDPTTINKVYNYYNNLKDYDNIIILAYAQNWMFVRGFNANEVKIFKTTSTSINMKPFNVSSYNYVSLNVSSNNVSVSTGNVGSGGSAFADISNIIYSDTLIWSTENDDTPLENSNIGYYIAIPANTITLVSQSGTKFTFYDKDQLQVTFTGEWTPVDFTFYVERYVDNEWQQFSDSNDYYELYGYENPYYIFWRNLNYYPAGTYRYSALLGNNPEQAYYSNSFQIYDTVIENNATGTVDSNGDIDINIDTGKTVDSIKDFLGEEPQTTQNEIEDSFPQVEIEDPTHNFFAWIFEQIEDIFTTTEDRTFTFSLYTGNSYTIHSNDITVPNSPLKTLVGLSVDFGICYYILRDIHKTIEKVKKGSFEQIAEEDITANMV